MAFKRTCTGFGRLAQSSLETFASHPSLSILLTLGPITALWAILLKYIEPETFPSVAEGFWFAFVSLLGTGNANTAPHTWPGIVFAAPLQLLGILFVAILTAVAEFYLISRFFHSEEEDEHLLVKFQELTNAFATAQQESSERFESLARQTEESNRALMDALQKLQIQMQRQTGAREAPSDTIISGRKEERHGDPTQ